MATTTSKESSQQSIKPTVLIGYTLFIVFIISLAAYYLFADFKGLTNKHGIDQAQISREFSRGHGYNTKFLRPFALFQASQKAERDGKTVNLDKFEDTYHAPLGPLVNAAPLALFKDKLKLDADNKLYPGDRIIAGTAMIMFLAAILVFYLLASRIFDKTIGLVVVTLLVLCDMLWRFTHTGLPTSLLLMLFGFALFFLYKAVESQELKRPPTQWAALSAAFFGLMALGHWITIWIFLGALIFAALALRPRGMAAASMVFVFLLVISPGLIRNYIVSGTIHGDAFYALYNGLGVLGESGAMRSFRPDKEILNMQGMGSRVAITALEQFKHLIGFFGSILAAPIFFLSLLHPFRRKEIASFRWAILAMWVSALIGMAVFGLPEGEFDSNQMHILFAPIMAAYGLAMIAILWNRMGIGSPLTVVRHLPFLVLVLISSIGMAVTVPRVIMRGSVFMDFPNYPPYHPQALKYLNDWTSDKEVLVTDMPWGTAWYSDRTSVWMTKDLDQFDSMVEFFDGKNLPIAGVYLSPESTNRPLGTEIMQGANAEWAYWILQPMNMQLQMNRANTRRESSFRYGVMNPMGREMVFWSNFNRAELGRPTQEAIPPPPAPTPAKPAGGTPATEPTILPGK